MSSRPCLTKKCACDPQPRILLVEDHPQYRKDYTEFLQDWGYKVIVAVGAKDELLQDAQLKARTERCHIALLDMSLRDPDGNDESGLDLIPKLRPIRSIVVTAFGNLQRARKALLDKGAIDIISKDEGPRRLRQSVLEAVKAFCYVANDKISWPDGWSSERVASEISKEGQKIGADEANDVITQLFPDAQHVKLERLSGAISSDNKGDKYHRSVVFVAYERNKQPVILKLMRAGRAYGESKRYALIEGSLGGNRKPQLRAHTEWWNLSGVVYSMISQENLSPGQPSLTFSQMYRQVGSSSELIINILNRFFEGVWKDLYNNRESLEKSIMREYFDVWQEDLGDFDALMTEWSLSGPTLSISIQPESPSTPMFPNPVWWLSNHKNYYSPQAEQTIVHGDLHGDNLLVDAEGFPWSIDFGRTRWGHVLTDFVELTQYILTQLADLPASDPTLIYNLAVALARPKSPDEQMVCTETIKANDEATKAFEVISALRTIARHVTKYVDSREYLWGISSESTLILNVLPETNIRREKLLLFASVICRRLDDWGGTQWPPHNWPQVVWVSPNKTMSQPLPVTLPNIAPIRILFLAANPVNTAPLQLEEELHAIEQVLTEEVLENRFEFKHHWAVRVNELLKYLLKYRPVIVHFSGHGGKDGEIILKDENGNSASVAAEALGELFSLLNDNLRCVILNACYTDQQAAAIAQHVEVVIGMSSDIDDRSATAFARGFYQALKNNRNIQTCFDLGRNAIKIHGLPGHDLPRILCLRSDPASLRLQE